MLRLGSRSQALPCAVAQVRVRTGMGGRTLSTAAEARQGGSRVGAGPALGWTLALAAGAAAAGDVAWGLKQEQENKGLAVEAVVLGGRALVPTADDQQAIKRGPLAQALQSLLVARAPRSGVSVVFGQRGAGKTTAARQAVRQEGAGVLYVDAGRGVAQGVWAALAARPAYESLLLALRARVLRCAKSDVTASPKEPLHAKAWAALEAAAEAAQRGGKRPVVVVLDNVDRLAAKEPEAFAHLLEAAAAHSAPYRLILVSGDPAVVKQVQASPAWNRGSRLLEVGDLTNEEAVGYLSQQRGLPLGDARRLARFVGGRIADLALAADRYHDGAPAAEIEAEMWASAAWDLAQLEAALSSSLDDGRLTGACVALPLLTALLRGEALPLDDLRALLDLAGATKGPGASPEGLVRQASAVLALDAAGRSVRFASPLARAFADAKYGAAAHRASSGWLRCLRSSPAPGVGPGTEEHKGPGGLRRLVRAVLAVGGGVALGLFSLGATRRPEMLEDLVSSRDGKGLGAVILAALREGAAGVVEMASGAVRAVGGGGRAGQAAGPGAYDVDD